MSQIAVGLMSGTSADGISAAAASFDKRSFKLLALAQMPYPADVVERIRRGPSLSAAEVSRLNVELGELFAQAALKVMKKARLERQAVACIGSHGQTIYHGPRDGVRNTFQIADPAVIAERTGLTVASHFRQRDIAAGGEGAPLIPFFDQYFYGGGPVRALLNIGGIANVTIVGKSIDAPMAFDTGPGNGLMDAAVREITGGAESHDHNGARAKHGQIDMAAVARMIEHPYFKRPPPKSTGLEEFGGAFSAPHIGPFLKERPNDALATLNYFTCLTVQEAFRSFIFPRHAVEDIVVSGGGALNKTLMKKLECLFAPIPVRSIEADGLPAQAKEPVAFAFFGLRCLQNQVNHAPESTGARRACVLGSLTRGVESHG